MAFSAPPQHDHSQRKAELQAMTEVMMASMLFGCVGVFAKLIHLSPPAIIFYRCLVASCVLAAILLFLRRPVFPRSRVDLIWLVLLGTTAGLQWTLLFTAIQNSSVGLSILLFSTYPFFMVIAQQATEKRKVHLWEWGLCVLALAGVTVVMDIHLPEETLSLAPFLALLSGFFHALGILIKKHGLSPRVDSLQTALFEHSVALLLLGPVLWTPYFALPNGSKQLMLLVLLGLVFSALPRMLVTRGLRSLNAVRVSFFITMEPVYAIGFAALVLGENLGLRVLLGGGLIVAALFLRIVLEKRRLAPALEERAASHSS